VNDIDFEIYLYENGSIDVITSDPDLTCLKCNVMHCDYKTKTTKNGVKKCSNIKSKLKNKYRKLQNYVYFNLKKYGNTIIGDVVYERLGKEKIKQDLSQNGFEDIYISKGTFGSIIVTAKYNEERDEVYAKSHY
jgi:hypothetical protein